MWSQVIVQYTFIGLILDYTAGSLAHKSHKLFSSMLTLRHWVLLSCWYWNANTASDSSTGIGMTCTIDMLLHAFFIVVYQQNIAFSVFSRPAECGDTSWCLTVTVKFWFDMVLIEDSWRLDRENNVIYEWVAVTTRWGCAWRGGGRTQMQIIPK